MTTQSPFNSLALSGDAPGLIGPLESRLDFTTRGYHDVPMVVPGSSVGACAIYDTVNRMLARGATPRFMTASFVVGDSIPASKLRYVAGQAAEAAVQSEVEFTSVETIVTDRPPRHGIGVTLSAIGEMRPAVEWSPACLRPGDAVIVTGEVGAHGAALSQSIDNALFLPPVLTDAAPLVDVVHEIQNVAASGIRMMYYPADGLASAVREIERMSGLKIACDASRVPVRGVVAEAARVLGKSPLELATASAMIVIVPSSQADETVAAARRSAYGSSAAVIGTVRG